MVGIVSTGLVLAALYAGIEYSYTLLPDRSAAQAPGAGYGAGDPSKPAAEPDPSIPFRPAAPAPTFWPEDRLWGSVSGWSIFETDQTGCFARKSSPEGANLVLGRTREAGDFILGVHGTLPSSTGRTLTLTFDGGRRRQPYVEANAHVIVGRYGGHVELVADISRSGGLQVAGERGHPLTFSLAGSRAALAAVDDCVRAMPWSAAIRSVSESLLPEHRLCSDRPSNGRLLAKRGASKGGGNKLKVRNSSEGDAIVKVRHAKTGKLSSSFFVHDGEEAEVSGLSDGTYRLQFAHGETLTENCADFANPRANEFDKSVTFTTSVQRTRKQIITQTTEYTVTLYAVTGGNAPTSKISQQDFLAE